MSDRLLGPPPPGTPSLLDLWPCDVCTGGRETDPETMQERRCRVCGGSGLLEYDPAPTGDGDPFAGLEQE